MAPKVGRSARGEGEGGGAERHYGRGGDGREGGQGGIEFQRAGAH